MTLEKLEQYFESINEKKYRALQIYEWLYQKRVRDIKLFSNIKDDLKNTLIIKLKCVDVVFQRLQLKEQLKTGKKLLRKQSS